MRRRQKLPLGPLLLVPLAGAGMAAPARAESASTTTRSALLVDTRLGPAYLWRSRSHALGHFLKPAARLGVRVEWSRRLELGGAVVGLLDSSEHYRVLGALAHARCALWHRPRFSLGAAAALGVGYDADILHRDLKASGSVAPYGFVALDGRWTVARRWLVGAEAAWENLTVAHVGLILGYRFGDAVTP